MWCTGCEGGKSSLQPSFKYSPSKAYPAVVWRSMVCVMSGINVRATNCNFVFYLKKMFYFMASYPARRIQRWCVGRWCVL